MNSGNPKHGAALIGAGITARSLHLPAHRAAAGSDLKWIMDINEDNAKSLSEQFGIEKWTTRLEDVLSDPEVDWLDISTPNSTHAELAIQGLRAGKHVLVQKPIATSITDAESMLAAAREAGKELSVFMCFRGDPAIHAIRTVMQSGSLGGIISIRGKMISGSGFKLKNNWRQVEGSGALEQLGIHMIDLFTFLTGSVKWVMAEVNTLYAPVKGDDASFVLMGLNEGVTGILEATYCSYISQETPLFVIEINGTGGYIRYQLEAGLLIMEAKTDTPIGPYAYLASAGQTAFTFEHTLGGGAVHHAHQQFIERLSGNPATSIGAVEGIRTLRVIQAIRESAASGMKVQVIVESRPN